MGSRESGCNEISPGMEVPPPPARRMDEGVPTQVSLSLNSDQNKIYDSLIIWTESCGQIITLEHNKL